MKNFSMFLTISLFIFVSYQITHAQVSTEWAKQYNGTGNNEDQSSFIVIDDFGNVYVTGFSTGSGTSQDFLTIKYNSNGDSLWVRRYNGPANGNDQAKFIAIDGLGNIYVTGFSAGIGTGASDYTNNKIQFTRRLLMDKKI